MQTLVAACTHGPRPADLLPAVLVVGGPVQPRSQPTVAVVDVLDEARCPLARGADPPRSRASYTLIHLDVYAGPVSRTNIDIDDDLVAGVMRRYGLSTKKDAVDFALRQVSVAPMSVEEMLAMGGAGWGGDLEALRRREGEELAEQWGSA